MQSIFRFLPLAATALILAATGYLHGRWTDRWGISETMTVAAAKLQELPLTIGDWDGSYREMDPEVLALTGGLAAVVPRFNNRQTGEVIDLMILYGRPGPVSVHTPDVCYVGAGYAPTAPPTHHDIGLEQGNAAQFWTGVFAKPHRNDSSSVLRILWSWSGDGRWAAPDSPRVTFASKPAICKLYVIHQLTDENEPLEKDPCNEFVRVFLPELNRVLFASPK
jgi:hypothetical protein